MEFVSCGSPKTSEDAECHFRQESKIVNTYPTSISASSVNTVIAMQWINYLYTDKGSVLAYYGVEEQTFEYDADGNAKFSDLITANEQGWSLSQAQAYYTLPTSFEIGWCDWERELAGVSEAGVAMMDEWAAYDNTDYMLPTFLSMTSAENSEYSTLYTDIETYVNEEIVSFINGTSDIDAEWDNYITIIQSLDIERCCALKQQALDRYNSR
jgi:putative aldouronate transport system substrate-binding protein